MIAINNISPAFFQTKWFTNDKPILTVIRYAELYSYEAIGFSI